MKNFSKLVKKVVSVVLAAVMLFSLASCFKKNEPTGDESSKETIHEGISIGGIDVSGLNADEAIEKLTDKLVIPANIVLSFSDKDREISTLDIDVKASIATAVKNAMEIGKTGTQEEQQAELEAVENELIDLSVEYTCSVSKLKEKLNEIKEETDLIEGENAIKMDVDKTSEKILNCIKSGTFEDITPISAEVKEAEKTLLGSFSTSFSANDKNRNENLRVACEKINGTVLQPGDIFDMNVLLGPQTSANGYKNAGVIENGKVVSAIAGGVCQVTTTMYNAAIFAELKIVERHNHSLMVGYVPLGRDAAVAGTYKNLRFQNDTDYPVTIEAYIEDYKVVCNIYGHEIHDKGHTVDYEKVWVSTINKPAEKITKDPNMYEDERVVTYTGKTGAKIDTYKLVYEDGKLISRTWFSSSTYSATADEVTVGTKKREEVQPEVPVIGGESTEPTTPPATTEPTEPTIPPTPEVPTTPSEPNPTVPTEPDKPADTGEELPTIGGDSSLIENEL